MIACAPKGRGLIWNRANCLDVLECEWSHTDPRPNTRVRADGHGHVNPHTEDGRGQRKMATRETLADDRVVTAPRTSRVTRDETKPSFLTTEFYAMVGSIAAILIAAAQADNFDAPRAWTLVAAVAIGYMLSRGLAKSGSAHRDRD